MLLIFGGANALPERVLLAHVRAFLGVPVVFVSAEVVDFRIEVGPHDDVPHAVRLRQRLSRKLVRACRG